MGQCVEGVSLGDVEWGFLTFAGENDISHWRSATLLSKFLQVLVGMGDDGRYPPGFKHVWGAKKFGDAVWCVSSVKACNCKSLSVWVWFETRLAQQCRFHQNLQLRSAELRLLSHQRPQTETGCRQASYYALNMLCTKGLALQLLVRQPLPIKSERNSFGFALPNLFS